MRSSTGATIDVDIGGTFTDCFVRLPDGRSTAVKTPTTGFRLAVGFMRALKTAATDLDLTLEKLLARTETIRYSTTVAMNTLLQRTGPRLALVATDGFHDVLRIARGASWMDAAALREIRNVARISKAPPLVSPDMVLPVRERIDCFGNVMRPLDEEHFVDGLRSMVDKGARGFVVSLLFSYINPVHEKRIRQLIEDEFPEAYLGAVPIMLSSEVTPKRFEYTRTNTTVLNAYLHQSMWQELAGMGDELREAGYTRGIMMVHNTGGMAEVYRTSAVQTYNGGPVAGLIGGSAAGHRLDYDNVLVTDMGGTSFDIGLVVKGSTRFYQFRPIIDRYWVDMSILETRSIGAGGGSIASINPSLGNRLEVGPRGAGSMPGPACYNQGGTEPTVTDADVVLGYINPEGYFGGKLKLKRELAVKAIETKIAKPLGISVEQAALRIKRTVDANMADVIARETFLRGFDPKDFVLFAFGGAGPTHCVGYGGVLGMKKMVIFPFSPVFCAWGASTMPIVHIYEASRRIELMMPKTMAPLTNYAEFNDVVERLEERARKDLAGEGYDAQQATFTLELDIKYGGQIHIHRALSPLTRLTSAEDVRTLYQAFEQDYASAFSPVNVFPQGGVEVHNFVLRAEVANPAWGLQEQPAASPDASAAKTGTRMAIWDDSCQRMETPLYSQDKLRSGHRFAGPAVVESAYSTVVVAPGYELEVDTTGNLLISKVNA
jgi:N-methylhydantoinase A/acetophenone carboxylase